MPSDASSTVLPGSAAHSRICLAFHRGDIEWKAHPEDWVRQNLDRASFDKRKINQIACTHVAGGCRIRCKPNPADGQHDYDVWFNILIDLDGKEHFYKFALEPDEDDNPGILVLSFHEQRR